MIIKTNRIILRAFKTDDWKAFQELALDYNASNGGKYEGKWKTTEEHCKESVDHMSKKHNVYIAIESKSDNKVIGFIGLNGIIEKQLDLGFIILTKYQNNELHKEALEIIITNEFEKHQIESIVSRWKPEWIEQFEVLKKLGFSYNGENKAEMIITKVEWKKLREI